jgi:hypothetical protein
VVVLRVLVAFTLLFLATATNGIAQTCATVTATQIPGLRPGLFAAVFNSADHARVQQYTVTLIGADGQSLGSFSTPAASVVQSVPNVVPPCYAVLSPSWLQLPTTSSFTATIAASGTGGTAVSVPSTAFTVRSPCVMRANVANLITNYTDYLGHKWVIDLASTVSFDKLLPNLAIQGWTVRHIVVVSNGTAIKIVSECTAQ